MAFLGATVGVPGELDPNASALHPWPLCLALVAELLSFAACGLFLCRLCSLGATARNRLFTRQLQQLATADIIFGVGATLQDFMEFGGSYGTGEGIFSSHTICTYWINVPYRLGRNVSVLTEAHIAVSFVCAAAQVSWLYPYLFSSLLFMWFLGVFIAFVQVFVTDQTVWDDGTRSCRLTHSFTISSVLLATTLLIMIGAYATLPYLAWRRGGQVLRNAWRTLIYPLIFLMSYALILYILITNPTGDSRVLYAVAQCVQHLNGFLNVFAYFLYSRYAFRQAEGRMTSSTLVPWDDVWCTQQVPMRGMTRHNSSFGMRRENSNSSLSDRRMLLHVSFLEGSTVDTAPPNAPDNPMSRPPSQHALNDEENPGSRPPSLPRIGSGPSTFNEAQAGSASSFLRASGPPLSAYVWRWPKKSWWPKAELAPALFEQAFSTVRELGEGSWGAVILARARVDFGEVMSGTDYAIKVIPVAHVGQAVRNAYRERDLLLSVRHPGVVKLFSSLRLEAPVRCWVLVMEFCPGGDLQRKICEHGASGLPVEESLRYAAETLEAVSHLHSRSVMHRDIKPANILLSASGRCKLADFGLAMAGTSAGSATGTPGYVAPEVVLRNGPTYGPEADVFGWGRVLECMLTGALSRTPAAAVEERGAPPAVVALVSKATSPNPEERGSSWDLKSHEVFKDVNWESLFDEGATTFTGASTFTGATTFSA